MSQASLLSPAPCPFVFRDHQIRTVIKKEQPWFIAKDVCKALGINWCGTALNGIPESWQGMWSHHTPSGNQRVRFISEPAVYKLAFRSNKEEADAFTNWIASEVVPSIRKTGAYSVSPEPAHPRPSKRTDPERKELAALVNAWVGCAPIHYAGAWDIVNSHFGVQHVDQLTVPQVKEACDRVRERIEQYAKPVEKPRELPIPPVSRLYNDPATVAKAVDAHREKIWTAADALVKLMETAADESEKAFKHPGRQGNVMNRTDKLLSEHRRQMRNEAELIWRQIMSVCDHLGLMSRLAPILHEPEAATKTDLVRVG